MKDTGCKASARRGRPNSPRRRRVLHLHPQTARPSAPTPTKARSKATKAPAPRRPTKSRPKSRPNRPTRSKRSRRSGRKPLQRTEKTGKTGQTVEYKIVVKNTGNVTLKFGALKDTGCEGTHPSTGTELARRRRRGLHLHSQTVGASAPTPTKPRSKATKAPAPRPPTKSPPKSTPNRPTRSKSSSGSRRRLLQHAPKSPAKSAKGRIQGDRPQHRQRAAQIRRPERHRLRRHLPRPERPNSPPAPKSPSPAPTRWARVGNYSNEASIEGNEGTGTKTSNKVTASVPAEPSFTIEKLQRLAGEALLRRG